MKNKKLTYMLLFLVVLLWGYLIYTIFGAINGNNEAPSIATSSPVRMEDLDYYKVKQQDTLSLDYRDPLYVAGQANKPIATVATEPVATPAPVPQQYTPPPMVPETVITYAGFIENESNQKRVAIVKINNTQHMIGKGESQERVSILDIQNTYIRIKHKGNTKTIYK